MTRYPFRNLVFEGGGVKGIAYVGALQILGENQIYQNIQRVAGTSAGAIIALLVGLDYSLEEINKILSELAFDNFLDDSWGTVSDANRLVHEFGWYKGKFFRDWAGNLIANKLGNPNATFNDVQRAVETDPECNFREMYFLGTNLSTGFSEVFSAEHTPRECIADAVRISMSIPLFFAACKSMRGDVYVDGGVLNNFPIRIFDRRKYVKTLGEIPSNYSLQNEKLGLKDGSEREYVMNAETIGFRLDSKKEIGTFRDRAEPIRREIDDFFSYAKALVFTMMESQQNQHLENEDWNRTIYIDVLDVGTTDFGISEERKTALIESGASGAKAYLSWYEKEHEHGQE